MNGDATIALRPQKTLGQIHHVGIMDLFLDPVLAVASVGVYGRMPRVPEYASAGR